jgi:predicted transcriptional regulator
MMTLVLTSFGPRIRDLRKRLGAKQLWLAYATGHTDAAVSYWEAGKRLPNESTLHRILAALSRAGASSVELSDLHRAWERARHVRTEADMRALHGVARLLLTR